MTEKIRPSIPLYLPGTNDLPSLEDRHVERLRREMPGVDWRYCRGEAEFVAALPAARAVAVWRFRKEFLDLAPNLTLIATPSAGREWIEVSSGPGLTVAFGSFHGEIIAETVLAFVLAFARGIKNCIDLQWRRDPWPRARVLADMRTLRGSHAVILGFGHIGKWIGRLLKPFGVRLTGVNRTDMTRPDYFDAGDRVVGMAGLDAELPRADHLILSLPGTSGTDGIIDACRLALLGGEACVYNVGRGNAIELPALVEALQAGRVRGAGLDVFPREPLAADAPIRDCPNVIIMPHTSAFAPNYIDLHLDELMALIRMHMPEAGTEVM